MTQLPLSDNFMTRFLASCRKYYGYDETWYPDTSSRKAVCTTFWRYHYEALNAERERKAKGTTTIKTVYDTYEHIHRCFTPEKLEETLDMLADRFSARVTQLSKLSIMKGRSRQEVINAFKGKNKKDGNPYLNIMKSVFADLKRWVMSDALIKLYEDAHPDATPEQVQAFVNARRADMRLLLENEQRLTMMAAPRIGEIEGFTMSGKNFVIKDETENDDIEEEPDTSTDEDNTDDNKGSKGERYADFRLTKLLDTVTARAKRAISGLELRGDNGKIVRNDFGYAKHVDVRTVCVTLQNLLADTVEPQTMIEVLRDACSQYGWMSELVSRIENDPDTAAAIYASFANASTYYIFVNYWRGHYQQSIGNSKAQGKALASEMGTNMRGSVLDSEYSLYTPDGELVSLEKLKGLKAKLDVLYSRMMKDLKDVCTLTDSKKYTSGTSMRDYLDTHKEDIAELVRFMRGAGMNVQVKDVVNMAMQTMTSKAYRRMCRSRTISTQTYANKLCRFLKDFNMYETAIRVREAADKGKGNARATSVYMYGTYTDRFVTVTKWLTLARYNDLESRYRSGKKQLATHNHTNLLHQVFNELANTGDKYDTAVKPETGKSQYRETIEQDFVQYENYSLGYGAERRPVGWLAMLLDGMYISEQQDDMELRILNNNEFNTIEYAKLSAEQKLTNALLKYIGSNTYRGAAYEVCIQGDYDSAYDFVTAARLSLDPSRQFDSEKGDVKTFDWQEDLSDADIKEGKTGLGGKEVAWLKAGFYRDADGNVHASDFLKKLADEVLVEIERINAAKRRAASSHRSLGKYEENAGKFYIFPELQDNGFLEKYSSIADPVRQYNFVLETVADQMQKIIERDMKYIEESNILTNYMLHSVGDHALYSKTGRVFPTLNENGQEVGGLSLNDRCFLYEFAANVFYARTQITKLLYGTLANFDGLLDFEKRSMAGHAPHSSIYTDGGKAICRDEQVVAYVADDEAQSAYSDYFTAQYDWLKDNGYITIDQYEDYLFALKHLKSTDGVGLRTLESYRQVMKGMSIWTDRQETAYWNIMNKHYTKDDIAVFMFNIKPVMSGPELIAAATEAGDQKPVKIPVLHKYAEAILLPTWVTDTLQSKSVPLHALAVAQEKLNSPEYGNKRVDLFLFGSGCKFGANNICAPFARDKKSGEFILKTSEDMARHMTDFFSMTDGALHTFSFKYWGMAASTVPHVEDDKISLSSQAENACFADIEAGEKVKVRSTNGQEKEMEAADAREIHFGTKTADIIEQWDELNKLFADPDKLEEIFQEELATKSYVSTELQYALQHLKDGTFSVPLYTPNVSHEIQELLSSIIKKRILKPMMPGSNILQSTGFGMDVDASVLDETHGMFTAQEKLGLRYDKDGNFESVEVYVPIFDKRLKRFADEQGNISPDRLQALVKEGAIPESLLEFIAYRTPSDGAHSVIPCRIKGFVSNLNGANIIMPKEVMLLTGHDYDGDKMRCHFKAFELVDKEYNEDDFSDAELAQQVLVQKELPKESDWIKCVVEEYDFDKTPLENSREARYNARVSLMFAQQTSKFGSRRMFIPGGCGQTKKYAYTHAIMKLLSDESSRQLLGDALRDVLGLDVATINSLLSDRVKLYNRLVAESPYLISKVFLKTKKYETPFSLTHSQQAFDYIMGGASMINVCAVYNASMQKFQRAAISYIPRITKTGKKWPSSIMGREIGQMFNIKSEDGTLASLIFARLANAAVDNNKEPILGYLNQYPEMSEMTFFLAAAGFTEEQIHLLLNQPVVNELAKRLRKRGAKSFSDEVGKLINDIVDRAGNPQDLNQNNFYPFLALLHNEESMGSKEAYIKYLGMSVDELVKSLDLDMLKDQISVLHLLSHYAGPAHILSDFAKLSRPDSDSGSTKSTIAATQATQFELDKFRNKINVDRPYFDGMLAFMQSRPMLQTDERFDEQSNKDIKQQMYNSMGTVLPEIVAARTLLVEGYSVLFGNYFPQAKASWKDTSFKIAGNYKYIRLPEGVMNAIYNEMITFKLFENKQFVPGDLSEKQHDMLVNLPYTLQKFKDRVNAAEKQAEVESEEGQKHRDLEAEKFIGNLFLKHLYVDRIDTQRDRKTDLPRISFDLNGPAIQGLRDQISHAWGQMMLSEEEEIRQLAVDLYMYNIYTNGVTFGLYEFAHMAPFNVLMRVPEYIPALQGVLDSEWTDAEIENFEHQFLMNHWADRMLLRSYNTKSLEYEKGAFGDDTITLSKQQKREGILAGISAEKYIVVEQTVKDDRGYTWKSTELYRVVVDKDQTVTLVKAPKLGIHNEKNQINLQYNPSINYTEMQRIITGDDSPWGTFLDGSIPFDSSSAINDTSRAMSDEDRAAWWRSVVAEHSSTDNQTTLSFQQRAMASFNAMFGKQTRVEEEQKKAVASNRGAIAEAFKPKAKITRANFSRKAAEKDSSTLYIFEDNSQRTSGNAKVDDTSWYAEKYGSDLRYPDYSSATVRGLDNARPVSTQKQYDKSAAAEENNWNDSDFDEFKSIVDMEFADIYEAWDSGDYECIVIPTGGLVNSKYSNITKQRTPKLYAYLLEKMNELLQHVDPDTANYNKIKGRLVSWDNVLADNAKSNGYEVSSVGDRRFSALYATFAPGTVVDGVDVSGRTLEYVYQTVIKKSSKGKAPAKDSRLYNPDLKTKQEREDFSYHEAYLPLWKLWAEQNPQLIEELEEKAAGKVLTDKFAANTTVSQARALADILNERTLGTAVDTPSFSGTSTSVEEIQEEDIVPPPTVDDYRETVASTEENAEASSVTQTGSRQLTDFEKRAMASFGAMFSGGKKLLSIVRRDESGEPVVEKVAPTPNNIREARKQEAQVRLNERLRELARKAGIGIGWVSAAEARLGRAGVADFDTANVTADGLLELIRIAKGYAGEKALPEEFAHVALEMLGHDHPLVKRLLATLSENNTAMEEAYDGQLADYEAAYGSDNRDRLILEAAGKLVAKALLYQEEIETGGIIKRFVHRVVDAIKSMLRRFSQNEVQNAIFDANQIASKLARQLLSGQLLDQMSLDNISESEEFLQLQKQVQQDLTDKHDVLSNLMKLEQERFAILKKRAEYYNKKSVKSKAMTQTESQIAKLKAAMKAHRAEDALYSYLEGVLPYLANSEKQLTDTILAGRPANVLCKRLNTTRDILYSVARALDTIEEAIRNGEVENSQELQDSIDKIASIHRRFYNKYKQTAQQMFEQMLANVYGEHGITVEIGKNKGRVLSIHEIATRADGDISFMSRWFDCIADCNDYALKAVDSVTRSAKQRGRARAEKAKAKIAVAMADLVRETGSRDQTFMFEYEIGEDGKKHKTGKYISEDEAKRLSAAQYKFYTRMMEIKREADQCIPSSLTTDDGRQMVMLRKYTLARMRSAESVKEVGLEAWEGIKNSVLDTTDDWNPKEQKVSVDFEGCKIDMLPVKFVRIGKGESFDDMIDDVALSIMSFAGMAFEYNELNGVINILENAKYMAAERDVVQKTGSRTQMINIETDDVKFSAPFTRKAAMQHAMGAMADYFSMHLYGHIAKDEGTFGDTRISKRKVANAVAGMTSAAQMMLNLSQRIANVNTGFAQIMIETAGKGVFNAKDVAWASAVYMKQSADRLAETGANEVKNKLSLFMEHFDVHQNNGRNVPKYAKGRLARIFNTNLLYSGLMMGEDYLSAITALALAKRTKMRDASGKETNLWEAYEVKYLDPVNKTGAYLSLKEGYTKADKEALTEEDERKYANKVTTLNFKLQGIYNLDDKSAIQQYAFGALIIMYRKWIAPALKRRYGTTQYNYMSEEWEEGYYRTLARTVWDTIKDAKDAVTAEQGAAALWNIITDVRALRVAWEVNYDKLTPYEKSNIARAMTEFGIIAGLWLSTALLCQLPPDKHESDTLNWMDNLALSQLLRLRTELTAQAPTPAFAGEALRILRSPFAALGPTLAIFQMMLPQNYFTEIKSGKYKGHKKAFKYFMELPIVSMYKRVQNFVDPSPLIQYYRNEPVIAY